MRCHTQIFLHLQEIIQSAEKVGLADAFISQRTIDFVRDVNSNRTFHVSYIRNTIVPKNNTAYKIKNAGSARELLVKFIREGKNVFAVYCSKKELEKWKLFYSKRV